MLLGVRSLFGAAMIALCAGVMPVTATSITTVNYSQWLTNVTTPADVFNVPTGTWNNSTGLQLTSGNLIFKFTGPDGAGWTLTESSYTYNTHNYNALHGATDGNGSIMVTMPTGGINAFFVDVASSGNTALTLTLSDGEVFNPTTGGFGAAVSHTISWLGLSTTSGSAPVLFDFNFGTSKLSQDTNTVEAATMALIGGGLLILVGGRRKLFPKTAA